MTAPYGSFRTVADHILAAEARLVWRHLTERQRCALIDACAADPEASNPPLRHVHHSVRDALVRKGLVEAGHLTVLAVAAVCPDHPTVVRVPVTVQVAGGAL